MRPIDWTEVVSRPALQLQPLQTRWTLVTSLTLLRLTLLSWLTNGSTKAVFVPVVRTVRVVAKYSAMPITRLLLARVP